jgi:hypothetical protein
MLQLQSTRYGSSAEVSLHDVQGEVQLYSWVAPAM